MLMVTLRPKSEKRFAAMTQRRLTPPCGWSTGFMATPRVLGQLLRLTLNLCFARDASANVLSASGCLLMTAGTRTQQRLICTSSASNNADHSTSMAADDLLRARWEFDPCLVLVWVVADHGNVVARRPAQRTAVTCLLLHVRHDSTFRHRAERQDVANCECCALSGIDELASVHALSSDEGLGVQLELVGIAEDDSRQRCASARVMDDLLHDTTDVAMALRVIEVTELRWRLSQAGVRREDAARAFSLIANLFRSDNSSQYVSMRVKDEA
jgi:hypothetical protein